MRRISAIFLVLEMSINILLFAQGENEYRPIPYTQKDRDMLIEVKVKVDEIEKRNEQRFQKIENEIKGIKQEIKDLRQEIKDLRQEIKDVKNEQITLILSLFGILITLYMGLFGFIIWDRRTFMRPIERKVTILEQEVLNYKEDKTKFEQLQQLLSVFKELAKTDENVAKVLKQFNLL